MSVRNGDEERGVIYTLTNSGPNDASHCQLLPGLGRGCLKSTRAHLFCLVAGFRLPRAVRMSWIDTQQRVMPSPSSAQREFLLRPDGVQNRGTAIPSFSPLAN